ILLSLFVPVNECACSRGIYDSLCYLGRGAIMTDDVRVRYAPSPTGDLHIGNARTALFNYLYAKHFNGKMVIRIEDTDQKRNVEGGEESQLQFLKWLGIEWDEGA